MLIPAASPDFQNMTQNVKTMSNEKISFMLVTKYEEKANSSGRRTNYEFPNIFLRGEEYIGKHT